MAKTFREPAPRLTTLELRPIFKNGKVDPACDFAKAFAAATEAWPTLNLGYIGTQSGTHYFQNRGESSDYAVVL